MIDQIHRIIFSTNLATSRRHLTPESKLGNSIEPYSLHSGIGQILNVTSVTTPKIPSDPKINWFMSGPADILGTLKAELS